MKKVNFKTTSGIIDVLENAVSFVTEDKESIELAKTKITGCKHAIQIYALSLEHAKMRGIKAKKLKHIEME